MIQLYKLTLVSICLKGDLCMNKILQLLCLLIFSFSSFASDSMAIMQRSDRTVVLINEDVSSTKLDSVFNQLSLNDEVNITSKSNDMSLKCKRSAGAKSCTFIFISSDEVEVNGKQTYFYSDSAQSQNFRSNELLNINFENSKGDSFILWIDQFQVAGEITKK